MENDKFDKAVRLSSMIATLTNFVLLLIVLYIAFLHNSQTKFWLLLVFMILSSVVNIFKGCLLEAKQHMIEKVMKNDFNK